MIKKLIGIVSCCGLVACSTQPYKDANKNIAQTQQTIQQKRTQYERTVPPVVMKSGYYVDTKPTEINNTPAWMLRKVSVQAQNMPINLLVGRLLHDTNASTHFDESVDSTRPISFSYTGTLKGALDHLANQTDYFYGVTDREISWSAFEDENFDISFMPGKSNYLVGQTQNEQSSNSRGGFGSTDSASVNNHLNDQQYSTLQGTLSVWDDLKKTLNDLKSKEGQVVVSESTTSVTVRDHPTNVKAIAEYIKRLNKELTQEVSIQVEVLEINLNKDYNYGIDWNAIVNALHTSFRLTGNFGSATNLLADNLVSNSVTSPRGEFSVGNDIHKVLVGALNEQGKVRVVTKPEVVTMNNQIASIRITQDTGYIESIDSSFTENYVSTSIKPGMITDGFTLYLLPKIQGKKVYMQISSRIANLLALKKESNQPANQANSNSADTSNNSNTNNGGNNNNNGNNQQYVAIQVPTVAAKEFNQRTVIPSGSTLIIAGYRRLRDETTDAKLFGVSALGGQGAKSSQVETLVLITPIILQDTGS